MAASTKRSLLASALFTCIAFALYLPTGVRAGDVPMQPASEGRELFLTSCASCHGDDGRGTDLGPSLEESGAAAADFQLRTGRMPLGDPDGPTVRKPPAFDDEEIEALAAYVASLGDGPEIPEVSAVAGDVSEGQLLFIDNCAACHGATGNGGAVGPDALAPSLYVATGVEVAEAVVTGPGEMPKFTFETQELNNIVAFIEDLRTERAPGGADIGGIGPVPEGLVGWGIGVVALTVICFFLGSHRRDRAMNRGEQGDGGS